MDTNRHACDSAPANCETAPSAKVETPREQELLDGPSRCTAFVIVSERYAHEAKEDETVCHELANRHRHLIGHAYLAAPSNDIAWPRNGSSLKETHKR